MAADEYEPDTTVQDYIADRAKAFTALIAQLSETKDRTLKEEGMLMLRAMRMSFKTIKQGEVETVTRLGQPVESPRSKL